MSRHTSARCPETSHSARGGIRTHTSLSGPALLRRIRLPVPAPGRPAAYPLPVLADRDLLDVDGLLRLLARDAGRGVLDRQLLDPLGDVQALDHHPEDCVRGTRVEVVPGVARDKEELAAAGIGPGVGHREGPGAVGLVAGELVGDRVTGASGPGARRVAALYHVDRRVEAVDPL